MRQTTAIGRPIPTRLAVYLSRAVFIDTAAVLVLLLALFTVIDVVELRSLGAPTGALLAAYGLKIPSILVFLLPPAATVATAMRTASLRRTGEWDALHSLGISHASTVLRLLSVPAFLGIFSFVLSAWPAPIAAARFEASLQSPERSGETCEHRWTRQSVGFVRFDCDNRPDVVIETDDRGYPDARWERRTSSQDAWSAAFASKSADEVPAWSAHRFAHPAPTPTAHLLAGQSMTLGALARAIDEAETAGVSAGALRAERGLRIAAAAACVVIPAALLALLLLFPSESAWRSAATALLAVAMYWVLTAAVWTAVFVGSCPEITLFLGVPTIFSLLAAGIFYRSASAHYCRAER